VNNTYRKTPDYLNFPTFLVFTHDYC